MPSHSSNRHSCLTAPSHRTPYLAFSRDRTKQTGTHLFTGRLPSLDAALKEAEPPISARAHDNAPNARGPVRRRRWAASLRSRTRSRGCSRETSVPDQVRRRLRGFGRRRRRSFPDSRGRLYGETHQSPNISITLRRTALTRAGRSSLSSSSTAKGGRSSNKVRIRASRKAPLVTPYRRGFCPSQVCRPRALARCSSALNRNLRSPLALPRLTTRDAVAPARYLLCTVLRPVLPSGMPQAHRCSGLDRSGLRLVVERLALRFAV